MSDAKPYIIVLYNHVGDDVYEKLKDVDPKTLDFKPEYDIKVTTVLQEYNESFTKYNTPAQLIRFSFQTKTSTKIDDLQTVLKDVKGHSSACEIAVLLLV